MSRDKQNIKTTDWLTRGMTEAQLAKAKEKAINEAAAELRNKKIKGMAKHCHFYKDGKCLLLEDEAEECDTKCDMCEFAKRLYNAGYRLASEVAREIFEEIDRMCIDTFGNFNHRVFAELKKKYTEGEG